MLKPYGIDDTTPEIMPLKPHIFDAINPTIIPPIITQAVKYAAKVLLITAAFEVMADTNNVNMITIIKPIKLDIPIPIMFLVATDISFFLFVVFLCIEKSLTFNNEYEGK